MYFQSFAFVVFFAIVFTVYWALRRHTHRMLWLLAASFVFYGSWNAWLIALIVFSASVDFATALLIERTAAPRRRRLLLLLSIGTNLGLLAFFKYANFFLDTAYSLRDLVGLRGERVLYDIILPLGISFYTFETISYIVDVYQGKIRAVRNPLDYALYIMFFPHLLAGPIVRPREFLPQLRRRKRFSWDRAQLGVQFFLMGLFKKVVLADNLGCIIDPLFQGPAAYGTAASWLAVFGYAIQVYCDFSGYSDMAIGLAHLLGFHLPANFHMPYFAANIAEFWRRWHISLSRWLRDYLYIPLGGNRGGQAGACRNLLLVMGVCGLWHGASWPCVLWGLYNGVLLLLHRLLPRPSWLASPWLRPLTVAMTFLAVCVGYVFFRAQSLADAAVVYSRLFRPTTGLGLAPGGALAIAAILALVFVCHLFATLVEMKKLERRAPAVVVGAALACLLVLVQILMPEDFKAFIYFQF
jgi:alginate O-acetyltransferase complex protein AlgI